MVHLLYFRLGRLHPTPATICITIVVRHECGFTDMCVCVCAGRASVHKDKQRAHLIEALHLLKVASVETSSENCS